MLELIKQIRAKTGAGMVDIKKALEEANGDEKKTIEILRKKGQSKAEKKAGREVKEGVIGVYIHSNNKLGAMVKLYCETDFVARNEEFKELARDIAMHICASAPQFLRPEDVTEELVNKEKEIWLEQLKDENKPEEIKEKILQGKEEKFRREISLLSQPFVKNPEITVKDLLTEKIGKISENIQIGEFVRFEI